jgi:hypothetical protein
MPGGCFKLIFVKDITERNENKVKCCHNKNYNIIFQIGFVVIIKLD